MRNINFSNKKKSSKELNPCPYLGNLRCAVKLNLQIPCCCQLCCNKDLEYSISQPDYNIPVLNFAKRSS